MYKLLPWIDESRLVNIGLCLNTNAIDYLVQKPHLMDYGFLSYNPNAYELLLACPNKICERSVSLNTHKKVTDIVKGHKTLYWKYICQNPSLIELIKQNFDKIVWDSLSRNPAAISILKDNLDKISWSDLCINTSPEAIELIKENPDKIDTICLSTNPSAIKYLEENPELIDYWGLSWNSAAIHLIEKYPDKINWMGLSNNPSAIHILQKNPDKIEWVQFSNNPAIFQYDYQGMAIERTRVLREELMMNVLHPRRIQKLLDLGADIDDI
jgi:hypothetical protein